MRQFNRLPASGPAHLRSGVAKSGIALALMMPALAPAQAQTTPQTAPQTATAADAAPSSEIVVTGTSLRGVAPAGAESLQVSQTDIVASGATSTQALLADIPQLSSFGTLPYSGIGGTQLTVNREDLRNLPEGTGGGSPTLVLMDGHRFAGDGIRQTVPDAGVIPPGMIDHVEVIMDGGSAVYGADAIGGVINFVTKHDFDGIQVNGSHGFGDHYDTTNIDFLAGKKWDSGSVYVGYSYAYNSAIQNADRPYEHELSYAGGAGVPAGTQCNAGNVQVGSNTYAITGTNPTTLTPGTQNLCDPTKYGEMFPQETRHSVMAGFRQDLTSSLELEVKGFYSFREDKLNSGTQDGFTVTSSSGVTFPYPAPYNTIPVYGTPTLGYTPVTPGSTAAQQVSGNFSGVNGNYTPQITKLSTWGITPTLNWSIGSAWHMKAFYNYGESRTTVHQPTLNSDLLTADVAAGTFNPYDPTAASNTSQIPALLNYENYGLGVSSLSNAKMVFDGPVFRLPGGEVKVAAGAEYLGEKYHGIYQATDTPENTVNTSLYPLSYYRRHEDSAFGEINLPLIGTFVVNLQGRYDHYSDFGGNFAPSVGAQFKPVNWITLRGKWNKAFQAPSPANLANSGGSAQSFPGVYEEYVPDLVNPNPNTALGTLGGGGRAGAVFGNPFISIQGSNPHLQPQRATTYDLGFDISPPVVPGLTLHVTYFHIDYRGIIGMPPEGSSPAFWTQFPSNYAMNPTYAQVVAIMQAAGISASQMATALNSNGVNCTAASCNLYSISNILTTNLGGAKVAGLDLGFDYRHPVSFGSIYAKFNGTYMLNYQTSPSPTAAYSPNGVGNSLSDNGLISRFDFVGTLGATWGEHFLAQLKWNHIDGGNVAPDNLGLGQTYQSAFNTFDFFAKYDVSRKGLPPIGLTLTITNMFNTSPPAFNGGNGSQNGYADGTVGRLIQVGASVKF
jgi:iron complex outermembrane receptor protein